MVNRRVYSNNNSGYRGVGKVKQQGKWYAAVKYETVSGSERKWLGTFNTAWEATTARNNFIRENNLPHKIQEKLDEQPTDR
jgi:hypothetical protein